MPARWSPSRCWSSAWCAGCSGRARSASSPSPMVLTLLYALGKYTPVFHLMYDFVPGVKLFRRPADATFVFGALMAMLAGYLVHRWLTDTVPPPRRWQRAAEFVDRRCARRDRDRPGAVGRRRCRAPRCRSCGASDLRRPRSRRWCWRAALASRSALAAAAVLAALQRRRSRLEQRAERVDRPDARAIRGAAPGHHERNRRAAEAKLRPPPRPTAATASS